MTQEKPSAGICTTCNNVETCTRRPGYKRPVYFCEEFDDSSSPAKGTKRSRAGTRAPDIDITMGLCCNCGNRNICRLSRTPGGIWHCEEYA